MNAVATVSPNSRSAKSTRGWPFQVRSRRRTIALFSGVSGDTGIATASWRNNAWSCAISPACFQTWPGWRRSWITMTEKRGGRSSGHGIYPTTETSFSTMHGTLRLRARMRPHVTSFVPTFDRARIRLNLKEAEESKKTRALTVMLIVIIFVNTWIYVYVFILFEKSTID